MLSFTRQSKMLINLVAYKNFRRLGFYFAGSPCGEVVSVDIKSHIPFYSLIYCFNKVDYSEYEG